MNGADISRAVGAATSIVTTAGLSVADVRVVQDSNKLSLRLLPCDVFARVAHAGREVAQFEVEIAQGLAGTRSPVAALDPRIDRRPHGADGFVVTLWTHYESIAEEPEPAAYADALALLHAGMREIDTPAPHFSTRAKEAQEVVADPGLSPDLSDDDRRLLADRLAQLWEAVTDHHADEQLLHGEPHPGNTIVTERGPVFVDLETCCRGPVEFDLAHVTDDVSRTYPNLDRDLLTDCRGLVLAMVAAWRFEVDDDFPEAPLAKRVLLHALREGPPWPTLDEVMRG